MKCADVRMLLIPYMESAVTSSEGQAVEAHLQQCPACQRELAALAATRNRVADWMERRAVQVSPSVGAWPRLQARIRPASRRRPGRALQNALIASSLVLLVLLVMGVVAGERTFQATLDDLLHSASQTLDSSGFLTGARAHLVVFNADLSHVATLDPSNGKVLSQVDSVIDSRKVVIAGGWAYFLSGTSGAGRVDLAVSGLDLHGDAVSRSIALGSIPAGRRGDIESSLADLRLLRSADGRYLAVIAAVRNGANWVTRVFPVDLSHNRAGPPIDLFTFPYELRDMLVMDGRAAASGSRIFVAQNQVHYPARVQDSTTWTTGVRVVDLEAGKIEQALEVPGAIATPQLTLSSVLAPDGQRLYLVQESGPEPGLAAGARLVAVDTGRLEIVYARQTDFRAGNLSICLASGWQITASGHYLYAYCLQPGLSHPGPGTFRFMDTQSGQVAFDLPSGLHPFDEASVLMLPAPDGRLLYVADPISREVAVVDLEHPAILRSASLPANKPASLDLWHWLAAQVVQVAEAKMELEPGLVLSPDATRLYLVDRTGPEDGDGNGVWAIDTASLAVAGHWLEGKDVTGLQLSRDGRDLYAASPSSDAIYVLDTAGGAVKQTVRAMPQAIGFVVMP